MFLQLKHFIPRSRMWLKEIIFEFFYITDINSLISRSENRDNISMIIGYTLTEKSNENRKFLITIITLNFKLFTSSSSFLFFSKFLDYNNDEPDSIENFIFRHTNFLLFRFLSSRTFSSPARSSHLKIERTLENLW